MARHATYFPSPASTLTPTDYRLIEMVVYLIHYCKLFDVYGVSGKAVNGSMSDFNVDIVRILRPMFQLARLFVPTE